MRYFYLLTLITLVSCNNFISLIEGDEYNKTIDIQKGSDHISILHSHNINGETHPCGCRHFPLGGLSQVAGLFAELSLSKSFVYVDTGDTFFSSSKINPLSEKSQFFTAKKLRDALNSLGLQYIVLGDQDFAGGTVFIQELLKEAKFEVLGANFNEKTPFPFKKWAAIKLPSKTLYFTGIMEQSLYTREAQNFMSPSLTSLENVIKEMKANGMSDDDHLIVLSHSGMEKDEELAKLYPRINWILGAHTQDFTKFPNMIGKTGITQVLSRNHYFGEIQIPFGSKIEEFKFISHEIRDELKDKIKNNPMNEFMTTYKSEVKRIQLEEEKSYSFTQNSNLQKPTAQTCIQCHEAQGEKWMKTAHSLAYYTLIQNNEEAKAECISCHSVNYQEKGGFDKTTNMILFNDKKSDLKDYWKAFHPHMKGVKSVRKLSEAKRVRYAGKWLKHDEKFGVSHNYANVQCLNCHDQGVNHPFEETTTQLSKTAKAEHMKTKCLNCHTPDQSPEWYEKKEGVSRPIDSVLVKQIQRIACPKKD